MRWLAIAAIAIIGYRGASLWQADDVGFALLLNGIGLAFLAAGLDTILGRRFPFSRLAGAWLLCQALHWGGPVIVESVLASVVVYLFASGVLGQALLLHFAVASFRGAPAAWQRASIYAPVGLIALLGAGTVFSLFGPDSFMLAHVVQDYLYAVIALVLLLLRSRRPRWFGFVLLAAWLPPLVLQLVAALAGPIDIAGRGVEPGNLFFVAIPLGFAIVQRLHLSRTP